MLHSLVLFIIEDVVAMTISQLYIFSTMCHLAETVGWMDFGYYIGQHSATLIHIYF
jgi:hypothetical protein